MGFISNLFKRAAEIDQLGRHCNFLQAELEREQKKNAVLESAIVSERKAKDKVLLRHADQMSLLAKAGQHFVNDAIPTKEVEPEPLTLQQIEAIDWAAKAMQDADIEQGLEPRPIETYRDAISAEPSRYLPSDVLN